VVPGGNAARLGSSPSARPIGGSSRSCWPQDWQPSASTRSRWTPSLVLRRQVRRLRCPGCHRRRRDASGSARGRADQGQARSTAAAAAAAESAATRRAQARRPAHVRRAAGSTAASRAGSPSSTPASRPRAASPAPATAVSSSGRACQRPLRARPSDERNLLSVRGCVLRARVSGRAAGAEMRLVCVKVEECREGARSTTKIERVVLRATPTNELGLVGA
jgi:hypothetical protein